MEVLKPTSQDSSSSSEEESDSQETPHLQKLKTPKKRASDPSKHVDPGTKELTRKTNQQNAHKNTPPAGFVERTHLNESQFENQRRTFTSGNAIDATSVDAESSKLIGFRQEKAKSSNRMWTIMLIAVTVLVFSVFIKANMNDDHLVNGSKNTTPQVTGIGWLRGQEQLKQSLVRLKAKYPSQNAWIQIYSAISSTMTKEVPKQPSAIVFLVPPSIETETFSSCLSHEIAKNTHSVFYNITGLHHTQKIYEMSEDYFKNKGSVTEIHDDIKTYLNNGKVVVVKDIQKINRQDHLFIFHAFCDNSAAPDKRATFIFIIPVPRNIYTKYQWKENEGAEMSQEILSSAWTSVSPDKRPALIARVAANIVMIQPGDKCTVPM